MSYRIPIRNPKNKGSLYVFSNEPFFVQWFEKSWDALDRIGVSQSTYEKTYNVKLVFNEPGATISDVEFPSEADATMFILRWT